MKMLETITVDLDERQILASIESCDSNNLCNILDSAFKVRVDLGTSEPIKFEYSDNVITLLHNLLQRIHANEMVFQTSENAVKVYNSLFKALRNYTLSEKAQAVLASHEGIMGHTKNLLSEFLERSKTQTEYLQTVKFLLQFLCNLTIHSSNKEMIKNVINGNVVYCLKHPQFSYITCALLYNVLKETNGDLCRTDNYIYDVVLELYSEKHKEIDYLTYIIEVFLKAPEFCANYHNFAPESRISILRVTYEMVLKNDYTFNEHLINVLVNQFKQRSDYIFRTVESNFQDSEASEVSYLLDIISSVSSNETYLPILQCDLGLLIVTTSLLRGIHTLGKETKNYFSPVEKLSEITGPSQCIQNHPAFGFKAALVRLVGNLCWRNTKNQDEVRQLDAIPVILDCSNIDARNPLIMQWVILAVRNLCEGNSENQKIVASLTLRGTVSSSTLREMGLQLHNDGTNDISVIPLEAFENLQIGK